MYLGLPGPTLQLVGDPLAYVGFVADFPIEFCPKPRALPHNVGNVMTSLLGDVITLCFWAFEGGSHPLASWLEAESSPQRLGNPHPKLRAGNPTCIQPLAGGQSFLQLKCPFVGMTAT